MHGRNDRARRIAHQTIGLTALLWTGGMVVWTLVELQSRIADSELPSSRQGDYFARDLSVLLSAGLVWFLVVTLLLVAWFITRSASTQKDLVKPASPLRVQPSSRAQIPIWTAAVPIGLPTLLGLSGHRPLLGHCPPACA